jgi:hypothetical protein
MSRTIQEIYDEIIDEKESFSSLDDLVPNPDSSQTFLSDLTSTSKVAVWRLISWVIAFAIWTHEQLFDVFVAEVEEKAKDQITGTARWYSVVSKEWQYGYDLEWDETTRKYIYSDTTSTEAVASRLVTQASATEVANLLKIKVAQGAVGSLSKLSTTEKDSFDAYIAQIKFAGTATSIISDNPDTLETDYTIVYDPLVLDANGVLISDGTTKPVEVAITNYIQGLPFDGILKVIDLTDAVQEAEGVTNAVCTKAEATSGAGTVDILAVSTQKYEPVAGYLELDAASTFTYTT